ncbi:hypothetical protein PVAND_013808 [Polypedilum vanderplanki]|uniref:ZAD domain-containing protein n=1 Tax=Polypedilum vanderplanki TaxID=319348 RepID=A0A9J6CRV1_POLVA|nr:hypothetical protein PVAND_013808 [Polypedilum vanderplanki]
MVEQKMCRLCMEKENLTSLWGRADSEKISEKIFYVCGIKVSTTDSLPKFICHECLSFLILGSRFKKKSIETEKILREQLEVECINLAGDRSEDGFDDPFSSTDTRESIRNKFLVYEENPDDEDQPKISYKITDSTIKIKSTKHFENAELKNFVDGYLAAKPNLEIIKVVNPDSIKEIERVIDANNESKNNATRKRSRVDFSTSTQQACPKQEQNMMRQKSSIMLLSALAGQRFGNININRMSSPLFNNNQESGNNFRN